MDTLVHADIFFFITSVVVVLIGIASLVALVYGILILKDLRRVTSTVRDETGRIAEDVADLRKDLRRKGFQLGLLFDFFRKILTGHGKVPKLH